MKVKDREAIARARKRKGYSQRNLAALCGCTQAAISAIETGQMPNTSKPLANALARWLDRDVEELFLEMTTSRDHRVTNAAGSTRHSKGSAA